MKTENRNVTPAEARAIAKEAYTYGSPMVDGYRAGGPVLHGHAPLLAEGRSGHRQVGRAVAHKGEVIDCQRPVNWIVRLSKK